jgi:hypothetical protein
MRYLRFLQAVHEQLRPPTYLEIGVRDGASLTLSRARSIGIDPAFAVKHELHCDLSLHRATSDDYFADPAACDHFGGTPISLAFIDGMHLFEYALRDFINVERWSAWHSVVFFDDMLPRHVEEAARDRVSMAWTGDVYKVSLALAAHRPDVRLIPVNTRPTGLVLALRTDPDNRVLADGLDAVLAEFDSADPQPVPRSVLDREGAVDPQALLDSGLFARLGERRDAGDDAAAGRAWLDAFLDEQMPAMLVDWSTTQLNRPPLEPWPSPKPRMHLLPAPPPPPPPPAPGIGRRARRQVRRWVY